MPRSAYDIINPTVLAKIDNLNNEPILQEQTAGIMIEYKYATLEKAMERIIRENPNFNISFSYEINYLTVKIRRV